MIQLLPHLGIPNVGRIYFFILDLVRRARTPSCRGTETYGHAMLRTDCEARRGVLEECRRVASAAFHLLTTCKARLDREDGKYAFL